MLIGDEVAREASCLRARETRADPDALGGVAPFRDRCTEVVQRCERPAVRVRDEQPDVLESIREQLGNPRPQRVESLAGSCGDEESARICVLDASPTQRIQGVGLVQHELHGNVVGPDLREHAVDRSDRLREALVRERRVCDVEHEIRDERLFERCGEALDELCREAPDEAHRVGDEVALAVVVETPRRRIERLEEAIVDRRVRAGERIQECRLPDVRVARERDRGSARADPLLPSGGTLALECPEALLEEGYACPSEATVRLELTLAGASRPDAAAESLEVLPHAAHPRQVVFELRELDLELALGATGVLGEDVENQLGAIDDARLERVLERALLRWAQLVVDEQRLGVGLGKGLLQLRELPLAHERPWIGVHSMLDDLPDGVDAGSPRQLGELSELVGGVRALREDAEKEPALRLRPGRGIGLARSHRGIMPRYAAAVTALADRLAARTLELVDIPSPSWHEAEIREHLLGLVPSEWLAEYASDEAFLFVSPRRAGFPLVVLVAHYDTVPPQGNLPGRIANGEVHGLGASDMKGGLAVALELARSFDPARAACDLALLLFGLEEVAAEHNPLPALFAGSKAIHEAALAVVLEPTDLELQSGCLGNVVARLTFRGTSGHSARPWLADSALERAIRGLEPLLELEPRTAVVGGLEFHEVVSVTRLEAGIADNVIPGEATATVNLRYPPDRQPADAETFLASLTPDGAVLEVVSHAPAADVVVDTAAVRALRSAGDLDVRPKQAWTNVADFTSRGLDAINFGPGHTALAHHPEERVAVDSLVRAYEILERFLSAGIGEDGG